MLNMGNGYVESENFAEQTYFQFPVLQTRLGQPGL